MKFYARYEATDGSGHFRTYGPIMSPSEEEARAALERIEAGHHLFRLDTDELAELTKVEADAVAAGATVPADVRSKLARHRQEQPYELTYFGTTPYARERTTPKPTAAAAADDEGGDD